MKKISAILVLFISIGTFAQKQKTKISIYVKDTKNKPIPGAIILIDDVKQKRLANSKGIFKVKLDNPPKEIAAFSPAVGIKKVKYVGQKNVYLIIGGQTENNAEIATSNRKQTGAGAKQFLNIYDYLRGKVSGVNISSNNQIRIRGNSNFNGGGSPLFILNGVQISETTFADIVPTTIRSVSVLKGPETAVYGLRGANGVIKVKTEIKD